MCDIAVALRKPENAPHARTLQVTTEMGSACTSQLATAHCIAPLQVAAAHRKSCFAINSK